MAMIPQGGTLSVSGNQLVWTDPTNASNTQKVRITGINWAGAEGTAYNPVGLHKQSYTAIIDQMADLGFNTIRLAYSDEMLGTWNGTGTAGAKIPTWIDYGLNPDLRNPNGSPLNALEVFDKIVAYAASKQLRVILDHHRSNAGDTYNGNGLWYTDATHSNPEAPNGPYYPESAMIQNWKNLAVHFSAPQFQGAVIGADLNNEPHNQSNDVRTTWGGGGDRDWKAAAERIGHEINSVAPNWLIFVEGVESSNTDADVDNFGPGGNLATAKTNPINTTPGSAPYIPANRLVYSAHRYGPGLWPSDWYNAPNFPSNLPNDVFSKAFGHIFEKSPNPGDVVAPMFVGEFGGRMVTAQERVWMRALLDYMDGRGPNGTLGDINADGVADLNVAAQDKGMGWAFWEWSPMSDDTGGILNNDWRTVETGRYNLLRPSILGASGDVVVAGSYTGSATSEVIAGSAGTDSLYGGGGDDLLRGAAGSDMLDGGSGNDELDGDDLYGVQGNDTLNGGTGDDFLIGGGGNDSLLGDTGNDTLAGGDGTDTLDGGAGLDVVDYSTSRTGVTVNLASGATGGEATGDTIVNVEGVRGSQFNDTITGKDGVAETIAGGMGADLLTGGSGAGDTLDYSQSAAGVTVNLVTQRGGGEDQWGRESYGDTIMGFENVIGSRRNDVLIGDSNDNWLQGRGGDYDVLDGGLGGDTLDGGDGWDAADYSGSNAGVTVNLATNANFGGYAAGDRLIGIEQVIGSSFDDRITGDNRGNTLVAKAGNDTLNGGGGDDVLVGGVETKTFEFGPADNGRDTIQGAKSGDIIRIANGGISQFQSEIVGGNTVLHITTTANSTPTWPPVDLPASGVNDLYVATSNTSGQPSNGSQGRPYTSIQDAMAQASAGTIIHVADGTYAGGFQTTASGTAERPIWVVADHKWGVKLVPPANSTTNTAWDSFGSHVRIMGFEVDGRLTSTAPTGYVQWRWGITVNGSDSAVQYCNVHDLSRNPGDTFDIQNTSGAGIHAASESGGDGFYLDNNVVYNIGPATRNSDKMHGIYISGSGSMRGNLVYNVVGSGLHLWHNATDVDVSNNTIDGARTGIIIGSGDPHNGHVGVADNCTVDNNIVMNCASIGLKEEGGTGTHNIYRNNTVYNVPTPIQFQNGNTASDTSPYNPLVVNASAGNYRLQSNSPALNSGAYEASTSQDLDGWTRGGAPDRGAYENVTGSTFDVVLDGSFAADQFHLSGNTITLGTIPSPSPTEAADTLTGDDGANDSIDALGGNDLVSGLGGNDSLFGGAGNDTLSGGDGDDLLRGGLDNDSVDGGAGNDTVSGDAGADTLVGGGGVNTLDYSGSAQAVSVNLAANTASGGDAQDDVISGFQNLIGGAGADTLIGSNADNRLDGGIGNDIMDGGIGNDTLAGGSGADTLTGGAGTNVFEFANSGNGGDTITDAKERDVIRVTGAAFSGAVASGNGQTLGRNQVSIEAAGSNTVLHIGTDDVAGSDIDITLTGTYSTTRFRLSGTDIIVGPSIIEDLSVSISPSSTSARLEGDNGSTPFGFMVTRSGSDLSGTTTVTYSVIGSGSGSSSADAADFGGTMPQSQTLTFGPGVTSLPLTVNVSGDTGAEPDETFIVRLDSATDSLAPRVLIGTATATGTILNDDTTGPSPGADTLSGTAGNDTIDALAGNDIVTGLGGQDSLIGNDGDDTLDGGAGNDTLDGGNGADSLVGGAGNDTLQGGMGADTLDGGAGFNNLNGGSGNDTYLLRPDGGGGLISDNASTNGDHNRILVAAGVAPTSVILAGNGNTLSVGIAGTNAAMIVPEQFTYGPSPTVITEIEFADGTVWDYAEIHRRVSTGTPGNDTLVGDARADTIHGGTGDDNIFGGYGGDHLFGDDGNDSLSGGVGSDVLTGGDGNDVFYVNTGYYDGPDTIADAAPGDVIRFSGVTLSGTVGAGNGAGIGKGQVQMEVVNGTTVLHIGTDTIAGSDGDVYLTGVYDASQFTLSGTDMTIAPLPQPTVAIQATPVIQNEGDTGTVTYTYTVTHSGGPAVIAWSVAGSGLSGVDAADFGGTFPSGTLAFTATDTTKTISFSAFGDTAVEGDEDFTVTLDNASGSNAVITRSAQTGRIVNDDASFAIGTSSVTHAEGASGTLTSYTYTVTRTGRTSQTASVQWAVSGATPNPADAADFGGTLPAGTLSFAAGETSKDIVVTVSGDSTPEADERFTVTLSNPVGANTIAMSTATGIIGNDDRTVVTLTGQNDGYTGTADAEEIYAQAGNDTVDAAGGDDLVFGEDGDDSLAGGSDNDTLFGAGGNDTIEGGGGADYLEGGLGNDRFVYADGGGWDVIGDFAAGDMVDLHGVSWMSDFYAVMGLATQTGADTVIDFGNGNGLTLTGVQKNSLTEASFRYAPRYGTSGDDLLDGSDADNEVYAGDGYDTLTGFGGTDQLYGQGGNDALSGGDGEDRLFGGAGNDLVEGDGGDDSLYGEDGADQLKGGAGTDQIFGGNGNDTLFSGAGNDYMEGGAGTDTFLVRSGDGYDHVGDFVAGAGGDVIDLYQYSGMTDLATVLTYATQQGDNTVFDFGSGTGITLANVQKTALTAANFRFAAGTVTGTAGDEIGTGTSGNDIMTGLGGNDSLFGYAGDDSIDGGAGADQIFAGDGDDTVLSGAGNDYVELGSGNDLFVFVAGSGYDYLGDFSLANDVIDLRAWTSIRSLSDLQACMTTSGSNTEINLQAGDGITVANVSASSLTGANFLFA